MCAAFVSRAEDLRQPRDTRGQQVQADQVPGEDQGGLPTGQAQPWMGSQCWGTEAAPPAWWDVGKALAVLTTSTVPPIKMNSLVMISTISRTCEGGTRRGRELFTQLAWAPCGCWPRRPGPHLSGVGAGVDAQEPCVLIAVVVGGGVVHPVVPAGTWRKRHLEGGSVALGTARGRCHSPVEHVEVEPREHALAGPASREGAAAAHHHVQHREGDEVSLLQRGGRSSQGPPRGVRGANGEPADSPGRSSSPALS